MGTQLWAPQVLGGARAVRVTGAPGLDMAMLAGSRVGAAVRPSAGSGAGISGEQPAPPAPDLGSPWERGWRECGAPFPPPLPPPPFAFQGLL